MKNWGGIQPDVFSLLSPPSLKTSTVPGRLAYVCFFCSQGLGAKGSGPYITGSLGPKLGSPFRCNFFFIPSSGLRAGLCSFGMFNIFFFVVVGQSRPRGTFGQLAQVPLLHRPHPDTSCGVTLQPYPISPICTRILLLNGPKNIKTGPLQLPTRTNDNWNAATAAGESR